LFTLIRLIQLVLWSLVLIVTFSPAFARDFLGRNIDSVAAETTVHCLDHDELVSLIKGKVVIGESVKSHRFGVYFKKFMQADGTSKTKVYRKGSEHPLKVLSDEEWFVRNDGILCSRQDGEQQCRKQICSADGVYIVVFLDNGTINGVWSVVTEENPGSGKIQTHPPLSQ